MRHKWQRGSARASSWDKSVSPATYLKARYQPKHLLVKAHIGPPLKGWLWKYKNLRERPRIEAAASGNGLFSVADEYDGVVRRVPLVYRVKNKDTQRSP